MKRQIILHLHITDLISGNADDFLNFIKLIKDVDAQIEEKHNKDYVILKITYDHEKLTQTNQRNAGRKPKKMGDYPKRISIQEVNDLIKQFGYVEAAQKIGMHYSTMYRRIQKANELKEDYIYY